MPAKKIFILDGHPAETSLSRAFAERYAGAARRAGHDVRIAHLSDLDFDDDFGRGNYNDFKPLEPALQSVMDDIEWSDHMVLTTPMWWGGLPARLKGLIDRAFVPGRAFDPRNPKLGGMPAPMLTGRSARVILTSDTPGWIMRLMYRRALIWQMRGQILGFVGIKPTRFTYFAGASDPKPGMIERWFGQVEKIGAAAA
ncbi:NAD(P)H-dependent oxidoreductase [Sedimentitalea sp. JM2-8]|uniref:NAD(P)H-dependent oxidoreductase n=1 Tax=Sedimentitalea xiamensis TaxID=3050037 RepID=A0ABT7FE24_9RHOB|nr:NAD(P)H-dependent oxidoreductase [Sedimentitalea xiamensis]MDK3073372.1 NAD(P)H-dependent oxidoreductase [Sedimentitalea xiamensis]